MRLVTAGGRSIFKSFQNQTRDNLGLHGATWQYCGNLTKDRLLLQANTIDQWDRKDRDSLASERRGEIPQIQLLMDTTYFQQDTGWKK